MSKLSTKQRKELKGKDFALPKQRKYPINDKPHASNAKARATQMVKDGKLSPSTRAKIDARANKVLSKGKPKAKRSSYS
jgi:hypothetical protein